MLLMLSSLKSFFYLLVAGLMLFLLPVLLTLSAWHGNFHTAVWGGSDVKDDILFESICQYQTMVIKPEK
jgi:hypothetical protein